MPAIKGDMYINTHCNYSQPTLIKLDNENIGGHLTPLQLRLISHNFANSQNLLIIFGRERERETCIQLI